MVHGVVNAAIPALKALPTALCFNSKEVAPIDIEKATDMPHYHDHRIPDGSGDADKVATIAMVMHDLDQGVDAVITDTAHITGLAIESGEDGGIIQEWLHIAVLLQGLIASRRSAKQLAPVGYGDNSVFTSSNGNSLATCEIIGIPDFRAVAHPFSRVATTGESSKNGERLVMTRVDFRENYPTG